MWATFARLVVLPVPLIPTKTTTYGPAPDSFLEAIRPGRSTVPASSNIDDISPDRLAETNSETCLRAMVAPTSLPFRSALTASMTSTATSDSSRDISSSTSAPSTSFSASSFSPRLLATFENAERRLSNMPHHARPSAGRRAGAAAAAASAPASPATLRIMASSSCLTCAACRATSARMAFVS